MSLKRIWLAGLLALLVGVGIVTGPAAFAATGVNNVTFNGSSFVGGATADWTIGFKTSGGNGALAGGNTIVVTFNTNFAEPSNPAVTLGTGFTGCTATAATAGTTDVVTVTLAGSGCALQKNTTGALTLAGITNAPVGTYAANTFTVSTSSDTNVVPSGAAVTLTAGAASKLAFVQGPSNGFAGTAVSPAITVQVQDQSGNPVSGSGTTITLTPSGGAINAGASANTDSSGRATFSGVTINTAVLGLSLTASASGLTSTGPSATFNVTVAVSSGATLTDTTSDGSGSGVKSVAYFFCAGYSGTCTSANWTTIGSSTSAGTNYQVSWTSQPANGAYRVVAVSTDNVTNVSQPSSSTPVTVAN
ncbi:hypothetical protein ACQPYH_33955 [Kribbella sp. CA-245084]|uniref:hypothetical protein n=1 Tax=Kribbella sp. CA-245084 TaxID=3239940 RepID=UPI003D92A882